MSDIKEVCHVIHNTEDILASLLNDTQKSIDKNIDISKEALLIKLKSISNDLLLIKILLMPEGHGKKCNCACCCGQEPDSDGHCACNFGCSYWQCC